MGGRVPVKFPKPRARVVLWSDPVTESLPSPKEAIEQLLMSMTQFDASDLHLKVGYSPYYRIAGQLRKTHMPPLPDGS